jgi:hypothetical protein
LTQQLFDLLAYGILVKVYPAFLWLTVCCFKAEVAIVFFVAFLLLILNPSLGLLIVCG